jgi:hypothetical protein
MEAAMKDYNKRVLQQIITEATVCGMTNIYNNKQINHYSFKKENNGITDKIRSHFQPEGWHWQIGVYRFTRRVFSLSER